MIKWLELTDFRNYHHKRVEFGAGMTIVVGPNTVGKTNLLEAIYLLSSGRSFRADRQAEMIRFGSELARTTGKTLNGVRLDVVLTHGQVQGGRAPRKRCLVNGVSRRRADFVGELKAVVFRPEDLEIVTDGPSLRRDWLNEVVGLTDKEYNRNLGSYERGLRQRNKLLQRIREGEAERKQLTFWDQLLIKDGEYVARARAEFVRFFNAGKHLAEMELNLKYERSGISAERLAEYQAREIAAGMSLIGPHRDDLSFFDGKRDVARYGSRGEQRLVVLELKLAQAAYVRAQTGEEPMLLLDDIFSELDESRREMVLAECQGKQVIITTADRTRLRGGMAVDWQVVRLG